MVKRIKKRVPKQANEESVQEGMELDAEGVVVDEQEEISRITPEDSPAALRDEIAANAQGPGADRFSEVMEGLLLNLADNWLFVLLLVGVGLGLYGFVQYSDQAAKERLAEGRAALMKSFESYEQLERAEVRALKAQSKASNENILGLSTSPASEAEAPSSEEYLKFADGLKSLKLSAKSAPLKELTEASARFDAAKTAEDFKKAAALFTQVAKNANVEPIAQSLALRNAATAYEEAASLDHDKASWAAAAQAWSDFGAADKAIFGLNADLNRARVLRASGDLAAAHKAYQDIKQAHSAALQDPMNREMNKLLKLGLALSAPKSSTAQAETK